MRTIVEPAHAGSQTWITAASWGSHWRFAKTCMLICFTLARGAQGCLQLSCCSVLIRHRCLDRRGLYGYQANENIFGRVLIIDLVLLVWRSLAAKLKVNPQSCSAAIQKFLLVSSEETISAKGENLLLNLYRCSEYLAGQYVESLTGWDVALLDRVSTCCSNTTTHLRVKTIIGRSLDVTLKGCNKTLMRIWV